jgi:hypothetical protein
MRCTPAVEEEDYEVMYSIDGIPLNFQYPVSAEPLVSLTSLWAKVHIGSQGLHSMIRDL